VQAAHAVLELGIKHGPSLDGHPSFVFLATRSKAHLEQAHALARDQGLKTFPFYESYKDWGLTAFACEPITQDRRSLFSNFNLWKEQA